MENQIKSGRQRPFVVACLFSLAFLVLTNSTIFGQAKYNPGDRVECNTVGSSEPKYEKYYEKGTVLPFRSNDQPDGSWYRVKADSNKVEYYCKVEHIRPIAGAVTSPNNESKPEGNPSTSQPAKQGNEIPSEDDFVKCPIEQKPVKNGARPNPELLKKLVRCAKGEKSVEQGDEGAVKVEIADLVIGTSRPWSPSRDSGNGKAGTIVYPVKATYTVTTFYRTATEVEEGWIRVLNFYVNAFGEWQIGSEENVKSPKVRRIQK